MSGKQGPQSLELWAETAQGVVKMCREAAVAAREEAVEEKLAEVKQRADFASQQLQQAQPLLQQLQAAADQAVGCQTNRCCHAQAPGHLEHAGRVKASQQ